MLAHSTKTVAGQKYSLDDLGILDGPPPTDFSTITRLATCALTVPYAAILVFDDRRGATFLRASEGLAKTNRLLGLPLADTLASEIRETGQPLAIDDRDASDRHELEFDYFKMRACIAAPINGPDGKPIGVLMAMLRSPHNWSDHEKGSLNDLAQMASKLVLLKASFQTLRLMSQQTQFSS